MINFGSSSITDVRLGSTAIQSVCVGAVEVWSAVKPTWVHRLFDKQYICASGVGWAADVPDLSALPPATKGCIILNTWNEITANIHAALCIYDGSQWLEDQAGWDGTNTIPSRGPANQEVKVVVWFNEPDCLNVAKNFWETNSAVSNETTAVFAAAADGVHIHMIDQDNNSADFVNPWPAGITEADLPPTNTYGY